MATIPTPADPRPVRPRSKPDADTTAAWVEAARAGDRRAFARLYRAHGPMVHGVLLSRLPRAELRDAMQEVFVSALAKLDDLREPSRFAPWLAAIARNCARDWHKRHANTHELSHAPEGLDGVDGGPPRPGIDEALTLLDALASLSEDYRELMILRFVEGLTGPEIAAALGMTPGSVRVKLHRGVSALRGRLGSGDPS